MADPTVKFTRLGKMNIIRSGMDKGAVKAAIIQDLRESLPEENYPYKFMFHVVKIGETEYFLKPDEENKTIMADSVELEKVYIDKGPFAGKYVYIPHGESDEDFIEESRLVDSPDE